MVGAPPRLDADPGRTDHDVLAVLFEIIVVNAKARLGLKPVGGQSLYPERGSGHQLLGGTAKSCGRAMAVGPSGN
jgi:hypothetical protein